MQALQATHISNADYLEKVKSQISTSPTSRAAPAPASPPAASPSRNINPAAALFNRSGKSGKKSGSTKASKKKEKGKGSQQQQKDQLANNVEKTKQNEMSLISTGIGMADQAPAGGHEAEVLDLADQLLEQLETKDSTINSRGYHSESETTSLSSRSGFYNGAPNLVEPSSGQQGTASHGPPSTSSLNTPSDSFASYDQTVSLSPSTPSGTRRGSHRSSESSARERLSEFKQDFKDAFGRNGGSVNGGKGKSRQLLRKEKKDRAAAAARAQAQSEADQGLDDGAEEERVRIDELCKRDGLEVVEMNPDGHCLFAAVADQINFWGISFQETYITTRREAAIYMLQHKDEFIPFLPPEELGIEEEDGMLSEEAFKQYCETVATSSVWGGHPEILALSKHFRIPIYVYQADGPVVKVGEDDNDTKAKLANAPELIPLKISYHRKMYGLGEHYNSLRPTGPRSRIPNGIPMNP